MAQEVEFRAPLDIPLTLNGNFGELRSNHFHAGIDLKTNGEIGLPIFCIEDGFVARVAVSSSGYGNVIYIEHPSGFTSVYGHLNSFEPELAAWVKKQQYKNERFVVNLFPEKNQFVYRAGDEIAQSGNSGSSGGPHLHFEIRKTSNQNPVNPLFFNFEVKDETKPFVEHLFVYPLGDSSQVQNQVKQQKYRLVQYGGSYHLKGIQTLHASGSIGFGVDAIDYLDGNWSKCGIYQMEVWIEDQLISSFQLDELSYDNMRYLNSHIDYALYMKTRKKVHKGFIDPGNKLNIYKQTIGDGAFNFEKGNRYKVQVMLYDVAMNKSEINFVVVGADPIAHTADDNRVVFSYEEENTIITDSVEVIIPKGALYKNIALETSVDDTPENAFSPLYHINDRYIPLHTFIDVRLKGDNVPEQLKEKALIGAYVGANDKYYSIGGTFADGWVSTKTRTFGDFAIVVDTIAPTIQALSITNKCRLSEQGRIRFKIKDEMSGIKSYRGTIDGNWVLFEFDAKRNLLQYKFDEAIQKGQKHNLELIVKDQKENVNSYKASFYY